MVYLHPRQLFSTMSAVFRNIEKGCMRIVPTPGATQAVAKKHGTHGSQRSLRHNAFKAYTHICRQLYNAASYDGTSSGLGIYT